MLITEIIGNINFFNTNNRKVDYVLLEWHETNKRNLQKRTVGGIEVKMEFIIENPLLSEGDIVYEDDFQGVCFSIKPYETF
jgi:urease accessory protein